GTHADPRAARDAALGPAPREHAAPRAPRRDRAAGGAGFLPPPEERRRPRAARGREDPGSPRARARQGRALARRARAAAGGRHRAARGGRGLVIAALRPWFSLVRFSHSLFALPFALASAWLAAGGLPAPRVLVLVIVCAVAARTAAMAFNRWLDRSIDAANPRTSGRELPRGALSPAAALALAAGASAGFLLAAW